MICELDRLSIVLAQIIDRHHFLARGASIPLLLFRHLLFELPPLLGLSQFLLVVEIGLKLHELLLKATKLLKHAANHSFIASRVAV